MFEYSSGPDAPEPMPEPIAPAGMARKPIAAYAAAAVLGISLSGYALHEHNKAQVLESQNAQANAALGETRHELMDLTTKVNTLVARAETQPTPESAPAAAPSRAARTSQAPVVHAHHADPRYAKLQSQLDAQGKAIEDNRNQLALLVNEKFAPLAPCNALDANPRAEGREEGVGCRVVANSAVSD